MIRRRRRVEMLSFQQHPYMCNYVNNVVGKNVSLP